MRAALAAHPVLTPLIVATTVAALLWVAWGLWGVRWFLRYWSAQEGVGEQRIQYLGQVGDLFGGINSAFAALAFVGVAAAAYLQHRTFLVIEQQRKQEGFEPLFFQLISLNRTLVPDLIESMTFNQWVLRLLVKFEGQAWVQTVDASTPTEQVIRHISDFYYEPYYEGEENLGPYFRSLYHVFKLIDSSGLPKEKRIEYADIARAMLSRDELSLMTINCASEHGADFRRLISKFGVLKHLSRTRSEDIPTHQLARFAFGATALMDAEQREAYWVEHPDLRPSDM